MYSPATSGPVSKWQSPLAAATTCYSYQDTLLLDGILGLNDPDDPSPLYEELLVTTEATDIYSDAPEAEHDFGDIDWFALNREFS